MTSGRTTDKGYIKVRVHNLRVIKSGSHGPLRVTDAPVNSALKTVVNLLTTKAKKQSQLFLRHNKSSTKAIRKPIANRK